MNRDRVHRSMTVSQQECDLIYLVSGVLSVDNSSAPWCLCYATLAGVANGIVHNAVVYL